MKKFIPFIAMAAIFTSCMKDGPSFQSSYTLQDTFEYSNSNDIFPSGKDFYVGFLGNDVIAYLCTDYDKKPETLIGGFALSRQAWKEPAKEEPENPDPENPETPEDNAGNQSALAEGDEDEGATTTEPGEYSVYGESGKGGAPIFGSTTPSQTFLYFRQRERMPEHDIIFTTSSIGTCTLGGIYVNNSAKTVRTIKGDNVDEGTFNLEGTYKLTATGYLNGEKTGSAEFILAKKGGAKDGGDSLVNGWKPFDLSKLGSIEYIDFDLAVENDETLKGILDDVCFDNFVTSINISY